MTTLSAVQHVRWRHRVSVGGSLRGVARDVMAEGGVVLSATDARRHWFSRTSTIRTDLRYYLLDVPPGDYKLAAFDRFGRELCSRTVTLGEATDRAMQTSFDLLVSEPAPPASAAAVSPVPRPRHSTKD